MITESPYTFPPALMKAYGNYLNHVIGCPRCCRGGLCRKGVRKRHVWRATRVSGGVKPPALPNGSRRKNGGQ